MQTTPSIFRKTQRGWHVKAQLEHYEPGRETYEFSLGDLVRHFGEADTIGTIVGFKWSEKDGHITGEKYEMYDVIWGDHGPSNIVKINIDPIRHSSPRKLTFKWTTEIAEDLKAFHGIDADAEVK
jgi:hypothetical protein